MSRTATLAGYAVIAALLVALQIAGLVSRRFPTIGQAAALVTSRRTGRYVLLAGWFWAGWHLFVRSHTGG